MNYRYWVLAHPILPKTPCPKMPTWRFALFLMIKFYNCFICYHYWVFVQHVEGWKQTISLPQVV
jgi:hypothetical protein